LPAPKANSSSISFLARKNRLAVIITRDMYKLIENFVGESNGNDADAKHIIHSKEMRQ
jgi:hypothetical protein